MALPAATYPSGIVTTPGEINTGKDNSKTYANITPADMTIPGSYLNQIAVEVRAVQTELGTLPKGSAADVKTRLAVSIENSGALKGNRNRNLVINGCARVMQRAAYTLVKDAYAYATDRFAGMATGTAVSAGAFTQATAAACGRTGYAHHLSGMTLTGTGIAYLRTRIEAKDAVRLKNAAAVASFVVRHDVGSAVNFTLYVRKANSADNFAAVTEIANSGAQSVASATNASIALAIADMGDCSNGIEIEIKAEVGAVTTKNVWIAEVQLEEGTAATAFEYRPFSDELARCQRYTWVIKRDGVVAARIAYGFASSTTAVEVFLQWPVKMRAAPALLPAPTASNTSVFDGVTSTACTAIAIGVSSANNIQLGVTVAAGLTQYRPYALYFNADESLTFDAEL